MNKIRRIIQIICTVLGNGYILGFAGGKIFTGEAKSFCVPFLNCYSCPGALGACPIGALQAVLGDRNYRFSFYALGMMLLFGVLLGRVVCGFLCPFGLLQDLLHKIKIPKLKVSPRIDKPLRYLKYVILVVFVVALPLLLTDAFGTGTPYFCKLLCPAGTLEGGIPLAIANESIRDSLGFLFCYKSALLLSIVILSIVIYRPFCKYLCPLGAFYGLFNKVSFFRLSVDAKRCTGCGHCEKTCPMQVPVRQQCNSAECIRCGRCKDNCRDKAIEFGLRR